MSTESDDNPNESTLNNSQDGEKNLWSPEEIIVLINLWEEFNKDLRKLGRHAKTYHQITERLQQELEREVPYTVKQVIKKIENLKRQYNYNKNKFRSETNPSPWRYYKMIHRFLHPLPKDDKTLVKQEISVYQQNPPVEVLLEDGLTQMLEQELLRLHGEQTEETDSDSHSPTASLVATPAFSAPSPSTITNAPSTSTSVPLSRHPPSSEGSCILEGVDISCHNSPTRKRKRNSLDLTNDTDRVSNDGSDLEDALEECFHRTSYELDLLKTVFMYINLMDSDKDELEFFFLDSMGQKLKLNYFKELITLKSDCERSRNDALRSLFHQLNQRTEENLSLRERVAQNWEEKHLPRWRKWRGSREIWLERELNEDKCRREWETKFRRVESKSDRMESKGNRLEAKVDKILDLVSVQGRMPKNVLKENNGC